MTVTCCTNTFAASHKRIPLLLACCNFVGPEPVLRNVEGAGIIV